jgi:hypothetical protein
MSSVTTTWIVVRAFLPFFVLLSCAFGFVWMLHTANRRRAAQADAPPVRKGKDKRRARRRDDGDADDDDDEDDDDDDPSREEFERKERLRAAEAHAAKVAEQKELHRWQAAAAAAAERAARLERDAVEQRILSAADVVRRLRVVTVDALAAQLDVPVAPLLAHLKSLSVDGDGGLFVLDTAAADGHARMVHLAADRVAAVRAFVERSGRFDLRALAATIDLQLQ